MTRHIYLTVDRGETHCVAKGDVTLLTWARWIAAFGPQQGYPWTDDTTPRTDRPVRFDYRCLTAWCNPKRRYESVVYSGLLSGVRSHRYSA